MMGSMLLPPSVSFRRLGAVLEAVSVVAEPEDVAVRAPGEARGPHDGRLASKRSQ